MASTPLLFGRQLGAALLLAALFGGAAGAEDLRIGMKAAMDGTDPHQSFTANRMIQMHVYEPLVAQDAFLRPTPGVAESWRVVDPLTWEFTLREGVRFHDGSPLTPADIAFSLLRAKATTGLRTYASALRFLASVEAKDARTVVIRTSRPYPLLPSSLAVIAILNERAVTATPEVDFNGAAAIGTGPYRWVRWRPSQDAVVERNPAYWGAEEPWSRVTFSFIANDSARVAALLAGDVDVIDTVPAALNARVRESDRTQLVTANSLFVLYMHLDQLRDQALHITGLDGKPLAENPLKDRRVRQAFSFALNRTAIAERAMEGAAEPIGQIAPPGFIGHDPSLLPQPYDVARARALMAEAGYAQGFGMTLHCTSDRFAGDARTCQVVGQMLSAIGVRVQVEVLPTALFFRRASSGGPGGTPEFTAHMAIYGASSGVASEGMNTILRTMNPALSHGQSNRGRYSSAALDHQLDVIDSTFDDAQRERETWTAARMIIEDQAIIPIFAWRMAWGLRRGLALTPSGDGYTTAMAIRSAP
ncbi:peptide/nickel transport system substrate-binding protein [Humitalea rosea]|uniref:Peptide/nickel transport system substrate-binding protein n=1 Tax=Humitalea rosea TaxID=990373 RepID=A0A2W7JRG2_9PROT|nr:ABC transporter substrate-binding protein [Humitalea rosea]PZW36993.1 peptide/nickel transport system substrate-binding protein [Humitalea rosea]